MKNLLKKIWTSYKYIYYREYTWNKKMFGESDIPEFTAVAVMTTNFILLIFIIIVLLNILFDTHINLISIPKKIIIIPVMGIIALHYFLFAYKGKYRQIEKEFANESKKQRFIRGWLVGIYSVGTIVIYGGLLFLGIYLKEN